MTPNEPNEQAESQEEILPANSDEPDDHEAADANGGEDAEQ